MLISKNKIKITITVFTIFIFVESGIHPQTITSQTEKYASKWNRVVELGKAVKQGSVQERLEAKEQILDILYQEEPDYPLVYVDQHASGSGDGSSWKNAFNAIQPAINYLKNQEGEGWVWVAQGVYDPINIKSKIMVLGGFSGKERYLNERNHVLNETAIRNKSGPGPDGPSGVTMSHKSLVDGFTIKNCGYRNYDAKNNLADNFVGGGIRTWSWFSIIRNNHIYDNVAASGSGIAAWGRFDHQRKEDFAPIIERNIIHHNISTCGAVIIQNSEVLFSNNIVCYNWCDIIPEKSKGVEINMHPNICDKPVVVNSIIWGNTKKKSFGDLYNYVHKVEKYGDRAKALSVYNCIEHKGYGEGLVKENPLFADADNYNFQLQENSPCIDAGHPDSPPDADSTRADIGIFILQYYLTIIDSSRVDPVLQQQYLPGSVVPLSADSVVLDSARTTQYFFRGWIGSGKGSYTGSVRDTSVCMDTSITEIIDWDKKYQLKISTGTDLDTCSGWYGKDSSVTLTIPSVIHADEGIRKRFLEWQWEAKDNYSSQDTSLTIIMNSPVELSAVWQKEYLLEIDSEYGSPEGEGWYQEGDTARFYINSPVTGEEGVRYVFTHWEGVGKGAYTGVNTDSCIVMWNPIKETACWKIQYFVDIESDYGNPQGEGWYDELSEAHISVDTVDSVDPETRMIFCGWKGNGYTGPNPAPIITMSEPVRQQAGWNKYYWVDITVDPAEGGEITPFGEPGAWLEADQTVIFTVVENIEDGYGFYTWGGDIKSTDKQMSLSISKPWDLTAYFRKGSVIITTNPSGLQFTVDGIECTGPMTFFWESGEEHEIDVPTPQPRGDRCRSTFHAWEVEAGKKRVVTVTEEVQRLTAYFNTEYYVELQSDYAPETLQGEGWYESGDRAKISIDSVSTGSAGIRHRFSQWTGTVQSSDRQLEMNIFGPLHLKAEWIEQYFLELLIIPPDSGRVESTPPDSWYDAETTVKLEAFSLSNRIEFWEWRGDVSSLDNPLFYYIKEPSTIQAHFNSRFNTKPEIENIPDITIKEDSSFQFRVDDYITDATDPLTELCFSLENNTHFTLNYIKDAGELDFTPQPNWFGRDSIVLKVSDWWRMADQDTFVVQVQPVDDPPGEFSLLYPENETVIRDTTDYMEFSWEPAVEVDGETVLYDLYMGTDSLFQKGLWLKEKNITTTHIILDISDLRETVYWGVAARDERNITWCTCAFRLTSVFKDWNISFDSFALYQNYPNPFNSETRITFYLPLSSEVRIQIFATSGRLVSVIADERFGKGVHALSWSITDSEECDISSGIYILQARLGSHVMHKKMMVVK
ncbi:MAG: T9SS type A sorting domain-containing protein [bacterium]